MNKVIYFESTYFVCCHRYIDEHQSLYIERLAQSVAIQSVSAWPEKRGEIKKQVVEVAEVCFVYKYVYAKLGDQLYSLTDFIITCPC